MPKAPDWEMNTTGPSLGICAANDAFSFWPGIMIPRQLGPRSGMSACFNLCAMSRSSCLPSSSVSLNPAVIIIMLPTFFSIHSPTVSFMN